MKRENNLRVITALSYAKKELLKCEQDLRVGLEAEILLSFAMDCTREWLHTWSEREVGECELREFMKYISRRLEGEPIEYITKNACFYGKNFYVDERVLIPRTQTEILVEKLCSLIQEQNIKNIAEIGVGSGIISIILALNCPQIAIAATDISELALEVVATNINEFATSSNGLLDRVSLTHTSLLEGVEGDFELLVSNPPYISKDYPLDKNVLYEPKNALFGGEKGDEILKDIIKLAKERRIKFVACEIGYDQKENLKSILEKFGYRAEFYRDLDGHDRGFVAEMINKLDG